jgi:hypothetical protein
MQSDEIAIRQIIVLHSLLSGVQCALYPSSQMAVREPVFGDLARRIDEPSV